MHVLEILRRSHDSPRIRQTMFVCAITLMFNKLSADTNAFCIEVGLDSRSYAFQRIRRLCVSVLPLYDLNERIDERNVVV